MFDKPITTIRQAREYFIAMGCSHFHMGREYPQRYEEYQLLNISQQTETGWIAERFDEVYRGFLGGTGGAPIWQIHSRMCELAEKLRTPLALKIMLEVTQVFCHSAPLYDRIIIAETINGRNRLSRRGLIYLAYDLGDVPSARAFVDLSFHFLNFTEKEENPQAERYQRAIKLCQEIKLELGL